MGLSRCLNLFNIQRVYKTVMHYIVDLGNYMMIFQNVFINLARRQHA